VVYGFNSQVGTDPPLASSVDSVLLKKKK